MRIRVSTIFATVHTDTKVRALAPGTFVDLDETFGGGETLESLLGPLAETCVAADGDVPELPVVMEDDEAAE